MARLTNDLLASAPIWLPMAGFLAVLLVETLAPSRAPDGSRASLVIALATIAAALVRVALPPVVAEPFNLLAADGLARTLEGLLLAIALAATLLGESLLAELRLARAEFHALLLASLSGMMVLVAARDLLLFFLGIELLSIPLYVLAAYRRHRGDSVEAGFKYFLLGAFASGFLVYGLALLYGAAGDLGYRQLRALAVAPQSQTPLWHVGLALFLVGVGFKIAAAPFHTWAPDVYQGAPTPVTAFMAAGVKAAAFGATLRLAEEVLPDSAAMRTGLLVIGVLSMVVGNLGALLQTHLKRMLAWSSIGHAGYLLIGIEAALLTKSAQARGAVLFYLATYALTTVGAFGLLIHLMRHEREGVDLRSLRGLSRARPLIAAALALCFLSLGGVPLTAGFLGKLYLLKAAWSADLVVPSVVLVVTSVIGLGYYLRIVAAMYMEPEQDEGAPLFSPLGLSLVTLTCSVGVLLIGVWPEPLLRCLAP
jgi:NADH-quinone oxidoreductase subunit N